MAQLQKGHTYNPGDIVDAADLNALVDAATGISGLIVDQGPVSMPIQPGLDKLLIYDNSAAPPNRLRSCTVDQLAAGTVTSLTFVPPSLFNFTGSNPVTTLATWTMSWQNQNLNKVLAAPANGSNGPPTFRALVPADLPISVIPIAAYAIDVSLGNLFTKTFPDNLAHTFTFTDGTGTPGQVFKVRLQRFTSVGTGVITWSALGTGGEIKWPGGTVPVMTTGANKVDIFEFVCTANNKYAGIRWGADMS